MARVQLPHLLTLLVLRMRLGKGFFALFPIQKSAEYRAGGCAAG